MIKLFVIILPALFIGTLSAYAGPLITLSADDVHSPFLNAKGVQVSVTGPQASLLEVRLDEVAIQGKVWRDLHFSCHKFQVANDWIRCEDGLLKLSRSAPLPVSFDFSSRNKTLDIKIKTASGGAAAGWRLSAQWGKPAWEAMLTITNGEAARIAEFLPEAEQNLLPVPAKGNMNGTIKLRGAAGGLAGIEAHLAVDGLAFSDASGLHAGENISVEVNAMARRDEDKQGNSWLWHVDVDWPSGEVFWQPVYFAAQGHRFSASGQLDENTIRLREGKLVLSNIGEVNLSGLIDRPGNTLRDFDLSADNLELSTLFSQVLKPFLVNTAIAELEAAGQAGLQWRYRDGAHEFLHVDLRNASVEDGHGRFAFRGVDASIPWQAPGNQGSVKPTKATIRIQSSQLGKIPIGQVDIPLEIDGSNLRIPRLTLPVLDGELTLKNFSASRQAQGWVWQFSGGLSPVSMQKLTEALGTQPMKGTLSGEIPRVSYNGATVVVDGALLFRIFDGTIELGNLKLLDPLGPAPSLLADLDMRNLDLNLLTGTFSFGNMQGRIDAAVHGLELFNWKPVKFDASLVSSPGSYPRRISQAAVQNISSLGGSGAAAAIQRSILGIFEQFGYSEIGWSCSLRSGICHMGGIESEPLPHGYLIVKGGGIPAITVIGYNREVDWWELVNRLQRITQVETKPVIQ
ncbi:hypothetical protein SAMN05216428_101360 [Nitrosospira sp. Nsp11]|uniref:hypothetical protein n=1 Tax=Nitrosospira sp. Nsp11 TaxID=1855338 RepID=UPI00091C05FD|nr:hypothetical protein [Nitrosospira sp. Nsp11]SHL18010.1 hypothetical protein SAMN05216428_101360 [Nitrosospira sp. Nsp11]